MENLIIEGFIGSGKGAVGKALAKSRGLRVFDLDKKVAGKMKMTSAEIYEKFGEPYYRAMETYVLAGLLDERTPHVVVLGSGVAMMPQNKKYLKALGTVIYIKLRQNHILENMKKSKKHSWIQPDDWDDQVKRLYKEREPAYRRTADLIITADGKSTEEIVAEINELLDQKNGAQKDK
jgi:shikimate kinase